MLTKEEHKALLDDLQGENADIIGISLMLMDNYEEVTGTQNSGNTELEQKIVDLNFENQRLRQQNTELFLRLGREADPEPEEKPEEPEEKKPVTYEDIGM